MTEHFSSPEEHLRDTLYHLRAYRELRGCETEPAVFGEELMTGCSVIIDKNTGDRIVMTDLPVDEADFSGAAVWLSNPDKGVEIKTAQWQAGPKDVIFWINEALQPKYFNPHSGARVPFSAKDLAERLDYPRIYPVPQAEEDPRHIPTEIEFISTPQTNTYTLASRIFDTELEQHRRVIARRAGIIDYDLGEATTFDLEINEVLPSEDSPRSDEFDREFVMFIKLGEKMRLPVIPWGQSQIDLVGKDLKVRVVREGMLVSAVQNGKEVVCIPATLTRHFLDSILHHASGQ